MISSNAKQIHYVALLLIIVKLFRIATDHSETV